MYRLVERLEFFGYFIQPLHGTAAGNQLVLERGSPEAEFHEVLQQVLVDDSEVSCEDPPGVDVGGVGLEALVVAHDLRGGCGGHRSEQEGVPDAVLGNLGLQIGPVPSVGWLDTPHVVLQDALAGGGTLVGRIGSLLLSKIARGGESSKVDGLENVAVELLSLNALPGVSHQRERIGQALYAINMVNNNSHNNPQPTTTHLHSDTNRPVTEVGILGLDDWVVVDIDDLVQVASHNLGDLKQPLVVELAILDKLGQGNGGEVAHGHLIGGSVLDDFSAQIAGANGAEVLLVGFPVASVLEHHVRNT